MLLLTVIRNQIVASDLQIISPLWSQGEEEALDDDGEEQSTPVVIVDPSKYLTKTSYVSNQGDPKSEFTPVLSKSKKKKLRQMAAKVAQKERNNVRLRGGPQQFA